MSFSFHWALYSLFLSFFFLFHFWVTFSWRVFLSPLIFVLHSWAVHFSFILPFFLYWLTSFTYNKFLFSFFFKFLVSATIFFDRQLFSTVRQVRNQPCVSWVESCILRHQILVTVANVIPCLSWYRKGRVQHYGTISNINRYFTSSNTRRLSCSRYEGVYYSDCILFLAVIEAQERERERERERTCKGLWTETQ